MLRTVLVVHLPSYWRTAPQICFDITYLGWIPIKSANFGLCSSASAEKQQERQKTKAGAQKAHSIFRTSLAYLVFIPARQIVFPAPSHEQRLNED